MVSFCRFFHSPISRIKCIPFTNSLRKRYGHLYWLQNMFELNAIQCRQTKSKRMDKTFKRFVVVVDVSVVASISTSFGLFTIYNVAYTQNVICRCAMPSNLFLCVRMQKCACQPVDRILFVCFGCFLHPYTATHHRPAAHGQRHCSMLNCILVVYYVCCRHACGYICCRCWLFFSLCIFLFSLSLWGIEFSAVPTPPCARHTKHMNAIVT